MGRKSRTAEGTNHKGSHAGTGKEGNVSRATHIPDKRASRKVITETVVLGPFVFLWRSQNPSALFELLKSSAWGQARPHLVVKVPSLHTALPTCSGEPHSSLKLPWLRGQ